MKKTTAIIAVVYRWATSDYGDRKERARAKRVARLFHGRIEEMSDRFNIRIEIRTSLK